MSEYAAIADTVTAPDRQVGYCGYVGALMKQA